MADGCIQHRKNQHILKINLAGKDISHLSKFLSFVKSNKPIYTGTTGNNKTEVRSSICEIAISSKKIVADLAKYGIGPRKSHTVEVPEIREELTRHMLRGIWDGDGSILYRAARKEYPDNIRPEVQLCGNIKVTKYCRDLLIKELNISEVNLCPVSSIFLFRYVGQSAQEVCNYLYKDSTIYLDRKYSKYLLIGDWKPLRSLPKNSKARKVG